MNAYGSEDVHASVVDRWPTQPSVRAGLKLHGRARISSVRFAGSRSDDDDNEVAVFNE